MRLGAPRKSAGNLGARRGTHSAHRLSQAAVGGRRGLRSLSDAAALMPRARLARQPREANASPRRGAEAAARSGPRVPVPKPPRRRWPRSGREPALWRRHLVARHPRAGLAAVALGLSVHLETPLRLLAGAWRGRCGCAEAAVTQHRKPVARAANTRRPCSETWSRRPGAAGRLLGGRAGVPVQRCSRACRPALSSPLQSQPHTGAPTPLPTDSVPPGLGDAVLPMTS